MKIRRIEPEDFNKGYLDLLKELSKYEANIDYESFKSYLDHYNCVIKVIEDNNKIIGAGSLFILDKIHCNPIGQIEDVVIDKNYRRQGLGKLLIQDLVREASKCYKIVLNANPENHEFYKSCGFQQCASQFKVKC